MNTLKLFICENFICARSNFREASSGLAHKRQPQVGGNSQIANFRRPQEAAQARPALSSRDPRPQRSLLAQAASPSRHEASSPLMVGDSRFLALGRLPVPEAESWRRPVGAVLRESVTSNNRVSGESHQEKFAPLYQDK